MKKYWIFLVVYIVYIFISTIVLYKFDTPTEVKACTCDKEYVVRVKLAVNDETKMCQPFLRESRGGFYKQVPGEEWRLVDFEDSDYIYLQKYCEGINYTFNDTLLLPKKWEPITWKIWYAIISIIVATIVLIFPFVINKRKKNEKTK